MQSPLKYALEASNLSKSFQAGGRRIAALKNISFKVRNGMVTGLIGPDAAGKSTLMRLASGLLAPDSGSIEVLGMDATKNSLEVQSAIGYMPQRFGLYEDLTVGENLDLYADLQNVAVRERPSRYEELLAMAGLSPFKHRLAGNLSGGMKQKLGLACALVRQPALLLLDESTVGVDPVSRRELWSIIYRLVREKGASVLLSTAYLDEAERCDEVLLLHEGELLDQGTPASFCEPMRGRVFAMHGPAKRTLQTALAEEPGVIDALIHGDHVRIVMEEGVPAPQDMGAEISPLPPRFEDSFVTMLKKRGGEFHGNANPGKTIPESPLPVIELESLQRRFGGFTAVKNVTFSVSRGEVFGLLGANGAGKSTTFRMLCGLLPPSGGKLRVAGVDLRHAASRARAKIGYMSQKFSLYGNLSVLENLNFFGAAYGLTGKQGANRISWALEEFSLSQIADSVSADLPLGYKQRLALACALMHEPEILFLDEPTSGVDPIARREFWRRINDLASRGVTVMVTTHFMEEAEYCDRLAIMAMGEILTIGTPTEIKAGARSKALPEPSMEDAFIRLIESRGSS
ncbi:MAG: ATP-binding cassette domain-containing protein [Burkholderiales bacterium]|nr:ATP-binding cassette domain-containing protein [Burkholderiales bacterium]